MQVDLFDHKPAGTQTLAAGDLELWRVKDGRFLIHLSFKGQKNAWIELSAEQASWLAAELVK